MTAKPHVDSGRLKGIAISSQQRSEIVPAIPTVSNRACPASTAPTGSASSRRRTCRADRRSPRPGAEEDPRRSGDPRALPRPGLRDHGGGPAQLTAIMQSEAQKWSKIIREANVKPE
jgi:hypothetical protein